MTNIEGDKNYIKFGKQQVELKKSDGVKKETVVKGNDSIMNALFEKFDKNNDKILDTSELNELYSLLQTSAKNGTMSNVEAKNLAKKLGVDVSRDDIMRFTQAFATENDGLAASWNGNTYTVKDGNKTTITEYADDQHEQPTKITVKEGNKTTVTEMNGKEKTVTTTIGTGDNVVSTTVEKFNGENRISKSVTAGHVTKYYDSDEKVIKQEEQTSKGLVTTEYEYDDNGDVSKETTLNPDKSTTIKEGSQTTKKESDGTTTVTLFDDKNRPTKITVTDANKRTVETEFNEGHKLSQTIVEDGQRYNVEYDGNGNTKGVVVQNGESPATIAKKFGVTKEALLEANKDLLKGKGGNKYFLVGQEIVIPGEITADKFTQMNAGRKTKAQSVKAYSDMIAQREQAKALAKAEQEANQAKLEDEAKAVKNAELIKQGADVAKSLYEDMDGLGTKKTFEEHLQQITNENAAQVILGYRQVSGDESIAEAILDEKGMSLEKRQNALRGIFNKLLEQAKTEGTFDETTLKNYKAEFEAKICAHQKMISGSNYKGFDELFEGIASGITSTATLTSEEKKQINMQTPEQQQQYVVSHLTQTVEDSKVSFDTQLKHDGWAADLADAMSVIWNSENRASLVREDLAKFEAQLGKLKDATPAEFPEKFREVFGVDYNPQMLAAYEKRKGQMVEVNAMYGYEQTFNKDMSVLLIHSSLREETDTRTVDPMTGMTTTIVTATKDQVYEREFAKLAKYIGSGDENAGAAAIKERMLQEGIDPATATKDEQYAVLRGIAENISKSLHDNVMALTENKGYDAFKVESDKMYAAAFGTGNDIAKRVEDYNISQQTGEAVVKGSVKAIGALALAYLTGGAGLGVVALETAALSVTADMYDEFSRGVGQSDGVLDAFGKIGQNINDMSAEQVLTIYKNAAIDGATVYAGGKLAQGLMNVNSFVRMGGQIVGDVAIGAAAEYGQTGEITINGVIFQAVFSAAGNLVTLKQVPKGDKPNLGIDGPEVQPLKSRDIVADGEAARLMDQSHLSANQRKVIQEGLADIPTNSEVEAFRQSLGEAPTPQQKVDIDAHNARVAEANAKAHQIGENLSDEALARLNGEVSTPANNVSVDPQVKALTDEINGLDGSIKRLEKQIEGAKKFGKNTQSLDAKLDKLRQKRIAKANQLQKLQTPPEPKAQPAEEVKVQSTPKEETPVVDLTPEQKALSDQYTSRIENAVSDDDFTKIRTSISEISDSNLKSQLSEKLNVRYRECAENLINNKGFNNLSPDERLLVNKYLQFDWVKRRASFYESIGVSDPAHARELAYGDVMHMQFQKKFVEVNDITFGNAESVTHAESSAARVATSEPVNAPVLTSEHRMQMSQIGDNIGRAKTLDDIAKAQAWLDKMPECSQKTVLQKQINAKVESLKAASAEQPKVQNVVNERINENGVFEKGKPVIVDANSKLILGGQYELDLASPEIQSKLRNLKNGETLTVGRNGDIQVPGEYNAVSRKHLEITRQGDKIVVKDVSSNGTKLKSAEAAHVAQNGNVPGSRPELDKYVFSRNRRPVAVTPEVQAKMERYLDYVYNKEYKLQIRAGKSENDARMAARFKRVGLEDQLHGNAEHFAYMASRPDLFDVSGYNDFDCWMPYTPKDQHHGAWKMHMYSVNEEDWRNMCEAIIPYLKEHDIDWKTFNAVSDATTLNGGKQQGKAFTIYPKNNEDMAQIAKDLDYIIRRNQLQTTNTSIVGDRALGDNGRLFYRYELKSGKDKNIILDLSNGSDCQYYFQNYDANRGANNYLAADMTPADDPWLYFDPSK